MDTKNLAIKTIDKLDKELFDLSDRIQANPETAYQEFKASSWLSEFLDEKGFFVERGIAGLPTAFVATYKGKKAGPMVAILAEYDALPQVGHGCGHNLIGVGAVGAAAGLVPLMEDLPGTIKLIGTPAEEYTEGKAGKILLLEGGIFTDIDICLMFHPWTVTAVALHDYGFMVYDITFSGKPAHAAADPWNGINALDAAINTYNGISALRQQLRPEARVHCIITNGGSAVNVIPQSASLRLMFRSVDPRYLNNLEERLLNCVKGAAEASGVQVEMHRVTHVLPSRFNHCLYQVARNNMATLGNDLDQIDNWGCSSDFGNVSQTVPSMYILVETHAPGINWHSEAVSQNTRTEKAHSGMLLMAKCMALSAIDVLSSPDLVAQAKKDFLSLGTI
jgi:amidohydrolase